MNRFPGVDFIDFDSLLTDEQRLVRDTVRAWVEEKIKPIIEECHREARFPLHLVPEMGEMNLFGANLKDYGLPGLDAVAYGLIMQELERGDSGLRSFVSVQSSLVMYPIHAFGSEEQKDRWLPAPGERRGDRLLRPDRARLRLQPGRHAHAGAGRADGLGAQRRQAVDHQRHAGRRRGRLGADRRRASAASWSRRARPASPRPSSTASSRCAPRSPPSSASQDCRIPGDAILPGVGGPEEPADVPDPGALRHRLGRARRRDGVLRTALEYAKQRIQFEGQPIAAYQLVQEKLAWMITEITKGQLLVLQLGRLKEAGKLQAAARLAGQAQQRLGGARMRASSRARSSAPTASSTTTR